MSDIDTSDGVILEALNGKIDMPDTTSQDMIDYVIERGGDSSNWYRLWKSHWLEQGGRITTQPSSTTGNITYLKSYSSTDYILLMTCHTGSGSLNINSQGGLTVNGFTYVSSERPRDGFSWYTQGWAEEE